MREYNRFYDRTIDTLLAEDFRIPNGFNPKDPVMINSLLNPWISIIGKLSKYKPHILVTAPSNIAVDNIIIRIFENGFHDGNAGKYNPNILRIGTATSSTASVKSQNQQFPLTIKNVSLEEIVDQETLALAQPGDRAALVEYMSQSLIQIVENLNKYLIFLRRLKQAYQSHALPKGWEVRIAMDTGHPYWVDHINRSTSAIPPPKVGLSKPQIEKASMPYSVSLSDSNKSGKQSYYKREIITNGDYTFSTLPEYQIYSHQLTQLLDQFEALYTKLKRSELRFKTGDSHLQKSTKQAIESSIIDSAHLVFTTLNSSGNASLEATNFCYTVVDEAAQVCTSAI